MLKLLTAAFAVVFISMPVASAADKGGRVLISHHGPSYVGRVASLGKAEQSLPLKTECGIVYDDTAFQIITPVGAWSCGSLVAVHNPANGQTAYARVIGRQAQFNTGNGRVADASPRLLSALGLPRGTASPLENNQPATLVVGGSFQWHTDQISVPTPDQKLLNLKAALAVSECGTKGSCSTRERLLILQTTEVRPLFPAWYPGKTPEKVITSGDYQKMDDKTYRTKMARRLNQEPYRHIRQEALDYMQDNLSGTYQGDRYRHWNITSFQKAQRCPTGSTEMPVKLPFATQHFFCSLKNNGGTLMASR